MHECPPPKATLSRWLKSYGTVEASGTYGHLLLEQRSKKPKELLDDLRDYFESAHADAREHFHSQIGISLHPDGGPTETITYPSCLPKKTIRGLFGEVMAGLVTEAYQKEFVGGHPWHVPVFLFREHGDVEAYMWQLKADPERTREVYGRHGTDFVALCSNDDGDVVRVIAGEAKWRKSLVPSAVARLFLGEKVKDKVTGEAHHDGKGIWFEINRDSPLPHGLRQMQRILERLAPDAFANTIASIDGMVLGQTPHPERTDLVVICGNGAASRGTAEPLIPFKAPPAEYEAGRNLQIVEVILADGEDLIEALYASLWGGN
ncbi:hypothetical protein SAMN04488020_10986 [Palleronia marisminoris]|nr:hypothetical protein SAMN04488020_10986 [Palleronia marisminoris]